MSASRARRFLRSPWTITAELAGIAVAGFAATVIDQHPTAAERARRLFAHPLGGRVVDALGLDRIFTSGWFLAVVAVSAASLALVAWEQWRRAVREWAVPAEARFRTAPYQRTVTRPARGDGRRVRIASRGRASTLGAPLFHTGLLVVTLGGVARMLLGADAAREVYEGQRVPAAAAFEQQELGWLAEPVALSTDVRLRTLRPAHHPSGELRELDADLAIGTQEVVSRVAVNTPLEVGSTRLYLGSTFGPLAVLEVDLPAGPGAAAYAAVLYPERGDYTFAGPLADGSELRLRTPRSPPAERPPAWIDVRVLSGGVLRAAGRLQPGATLALPGGGAIALRDVRWWVRMVASRDPSTWPVYAGFALTVLGVVLMFALTRVDTLVAVEPRGDTEEVRVALRPAAHAPAYADEFERLVRSEQ